MQINSTIYEVHTFKFYAKKKKYDFTWNFLRKILDILINDQL